MGETSWLRYARQLRLPEFGVDAQTALAAAHVAVVGAGGLGVAVIPALAAAGVGRVDVIDDDVIEESNLARQVIYRHADIGRAKAVVATDVARANNPQVDVHAVVTRFADHDDATLLDGCELVIDASDNFATRYLLDDCAAELGVPVVWGSVHQYDGQMSLSWSERGPVFRDLFPSAPVDGEVEDCAIAGVLPTVCAVIGTLMAHQALRILSGAEVRLGVLTFFDGRSMRFRELEYGRSAQPAVNAQPPVKPTSPTSPANAPSETNLANAAGGSASVALISAGELHEALLHSTPPVVVDVREPWELDLAGFAGALSIPLGAIDARMHELDRDASVVVLCHRGSRSATAARQLTAAGFADVRSLDGGIDAWARDIDPTIARY